MRRSSFAPRTELLSRTPALLSLHDPPNAIHPTSAKRLASPRPSARKTCSGIHAWRLMRDSSLFCAIDESSIYSLVNSFHAALGSDRKCTSV